MPIVVTQIRNAKPGPKPYKLTDEKGLFLLVQPSGGMLWRMKYRIDGNDDEGRPKRIEKKLGLGTYPEVSLKEARERRDEARRMLANGIDPAEQKQRDKHAAKVAAANTFGVVARAYIAKNKRDGLAEATIIKREWFTRLVEKSLGHRPIGEIKPYEVLDAVRPFEASKNDEKAHRTLQFIGQVFRYAVANQLAPSDPTRDLRGALAKRSAKHHAAILDPEKAGEMLRAIDGYEGHPSTRIALQLSALLFVRPGELRRAEWSEIDATSNVWRIPAAKMKARQAALDAGISVVQFVHEPMAALYAYFRAQPDFQRKMSDLEGQKLLVFDWGGGTLDLTLCIVTRGRLIQIANRGDNDVGGDLFDDILRNLVREKHAQEYGLEDVTALEAEDVRVRLLTSCERAKIELSTSEKTPITVKGYLRSQPGRDLALELTRHELDAAVRHLADKGLAQIDRILEDAGIALQDIALCLPTGGMVQMPLIRNGLLQRFGARLKTNLNGDRLIAEGAAWLAYDGARLKLAKPIELLQPDQGYVTLVSENFTLPVENQTIQIDHRMFYCVDPRDGVAHFEFVRPTRIGYGSQRANRITYASATLKVDPYARPLTERLEAHIEVDSDYIVSVELTSKGRGDSLCVEIHDLEFSLALPGADEDSAPGRQGGSEKQGNDKPQRSGSVRLRSNVTTAQDAWSLVPGDIVNQFSPNWFDVRGKATEQQKFERYYYAPCATCRRSAFECEWDGCDDARCASTLPSRAAAVERRAGL